ncbi:MAG: glycoside hydrolase family 31 protein [Terriglobia bacterium]
MHKTMAVHVGILILLVTLFFSAPPGLAQSLQPFASTPEYKSMLDELARQAPRPSRIANEGELITGRQPDVPVQEKESAEGLRLETQTWTLEVAGNPFGITFTNKLTGAGWKLAGVSYEGSGAASPGPAKGSAANTIVRLERAGSIEKRQSSWVLAGTLEGSPETVRIEISLAGPNAVGISIDGSRLGIETSSEFNITGPGPFFGLGEQYAKANLDNLKTPLHPDDKPGTPGHLWDYMSVPFVYSPKGVGVYFDTAFNCWFDSTGAGQSGFMMRFGGASVDFYLLAAPDPKGVLETYTGLTGRSPLPPPWAFGVWHNSLEGSEAVLKDAQDLRNARIPVSALWVSDLMDPNDNIGWPLWTAGYYGPPGPFTEDLHKLGFKVLAYFYPYVRSLLLPYPLENPTFAEAVRNHYLVTDPQGKPVGPTFEPVLTGNVDFTNPAAVNWYQEKIQRALSQYNFDGWMEDFGEWIHDDHRFAAGETGRVMATLNPLFWHKITYEIAHRAKPDVVEFARSGAPGSQAFTRVLWGGDQMADWSPDNGLASVVTAGITAGLSGFAVWGPDILSGGTSKELFIRWTEFGAMTPIMRDHLWSKPQFAVDLWFDSQTTDVFRRYARLHVSLFPYLYTCAQEASRTGLPIIRHPMLEFPGDPATYKTEYEYLLGDRLLVAPVVTEGATTRTLYLPTGSWVNYWTGEIMEGGKEVAVPAPLEEIPILAKAGSVIPFTRPDLDTLAADLAGEKYQTLDNSLVWRIFPSREPTTASFTVYDGAKVSVEQSPTTIQVQGDSPKPRQYEVEMTMDRAPRDVLLSGHRLDKLGDSAVRTEKTGWTFDPDTKTLDVLFLDSDFKLRVLIGL